MTSGFYDNNADILSRYVTQEYMLNAFPGNKLDRLYTGLQACGNSEFGQLGEFSATTAIKRLNIASVSQVSVGERHTMVVKSDGTVWGVGSNEYGQLGLGTNVQNFSIFQQVPLLSNVKQLVCGARFTYALKFDGTVVACGDNYYDQLGVAGGGSFNTFNNVPISNITQIACGPNHVFALDDTNAMWVCGNNEYGQLGTGDTNKVSVFKSVDIQFPISKIATSARHTMLITSTGWLLASGYNDTGAFGFGDGSNTTTFTYGAISNVKQVACNDKMTAIIKNDGAFLVSGTSTRGVLGLGLNPTNVSSFTRLYTIINPKSVAVGTNHIALLNTDGTILVSGSNANGQLGISGVTETFTFKQSPNFKNVKQLICGPFNIVCLTTPVSWV
jgi:alpha-tubulin suppressor-like RCC1 family protein